MRRNAADGSSEVPSLLRRRLRFSTQLRNAFPASGAGRGREDARQDRRTRLPGGGGRCGRSDAPARPGRGAPRPHCGTRPTGAHAWPPPTPRLRPGERAPPAPGPHPPPTRTEARRAQPWLRRPLRRRGDKEGAGGRERPRQLRGDELRLCPSPWDRPVVAAARRCRALHQSPETPRLAGEAWPEHVGLLGGSNVMMGGPKVVGGRV